MTEDEFIRRLGIVQDRIDRVNKSFNTSNIPVSYYVQYLKEELNLDLNDDKYYQ